jgi:hypothetical protein
LLYPLKTEKDMPLEESLKRPWAGPRPSLPALLALLLWPQLAFGYIDPGSGSYLFQLLIASLLGGLYAVKLFWHKVKAFFSKLTGKKDAAPKDHP